MDTGPRRVLTVSELTALLRASVEQQFRDVWVEGEVSNLRAPSSGHLYFTLKDRGAQIRMVLFRLSAQRLRFALREGLHVVVRGRLTVYDPRGEYQAVVDYVEPKGVGALQVAFEQLKERLAAEGLFDRARKRPLPFIPRRVGIVTSPTGAAVRDMLTVLERRCPCVHVLIAPVPVQGDGAARRIAEAVMELGRSGSVDVIIVGRGGGSLEDLWCFNEEVVVRAIAKSPVPIVSAVGHETDVTLADFAADYRAPTPSAAAEAVAPVLDDVVHTLEHMTARQERAVRHRLRTVQHEIIGHCRALPLVAVQLQRRMQRVDDAMSRLPHTLTALLSRHRRRLVAAAQHIAAKGPLARIRGGLLVIPQLVKRQEQQCCALLAAKRQAVRAMMTALNGLSPLAVLDRGYAVLKREPFHEVIKRVADVRPGDRLTARLADGRLECEITDVLPDAP